MHARRELNAGNFNKTKPGDRNVEIESFEPENSPRARGALPRRRCSFQPHKRLPGCNPPLRDSEQV
jgi:hypothetical protein